MARVSLKLACPVVRGRLFYPPLLLDQKNTEQPRYVNTWAGQFSMSGCLGVFWFSSKMKQ